MNIPITKTIFGQEEAEAIVKPLETGWVVQGPNVAKFQEMFSEFTGAKHSHATTSCTTALHLGLEAMGIGRGDKIIVPSFTYVASANAVEYTGAEVVFCDIDLKSFNITSKIFKLPSHIIVSITKVSQKLIREINVSITVFYNYSWNYFIYRCKKRSYFRQNNVSCFYGFTFDKVLRQ